MYWNTGTFRFALRTGIRVFKDPAKWSRFRWLASIWALAVGTAVMGGAFAVAGDHIVLAKGAFALYARIPLGGLHVHGVLMLASSLPLLLGLALPLYGYPEPRLLMRRTLRVAAGYWWWSTILLAMAPLMRDGSFSLVGTVSWAMVASWFTILAMSSPPELISRTELAILRAAVDVGVPLDQARALIGRYLDAGGDRELG